MADNILKGTIKIEPAPGTQRAISILENQVTRLQKIMSTSDLGHKQFDRLNKLLISAQAQLDKTTRSVGRMNQSLGTGEVAKSTRDFTNLGRVIQDLPFGFIGIQNNLTQLLPAVGGLGLAFSALISGLTFAQTGFGAWTRGLSGASKEVDELQEKLNDLIRPMEEIRENATAGTEEELAKVRVLSQIVLDQTESYSKRNGALRELGKINESYFGDLTLEAGHLETLKNRVNEYSNAIIAQAVIKAFSDDIGKLAVELSNQRRELQKSTDEVNKYRKALKSTKDDISGAEGIPDAELFATSFINPSAKRLNAAIQAQKDQMKVVNDIFNQKASLTNELNEAIKESLEFRPLDIKTETDDKSKFFFLFEFLPFDPDGKLKPEQRSKLIDAADKFSKEFGDIFKGIDFRIQGKTDDGTIEAAKTFWDNYKKGLFDLKPPSIDIPANINIIPEVSDDISQVDRFIQGINANINKEGQSPIIITAEVKLKMEENDKIAAQIKSRIDSLNAAIEATMKQLAVSIASAFGEAIGTALSGGDIGKVFQDLGKLIGGALQRLGEQMIALSPIIAALKAGIKTLNPAILLPAGVGLVAIGAILKNAISNVPGFAQGGVVPPGYPNDTFLARLTSGERIIPANQSYNLQGGGGVVMPNYLPAHRVDGDTLLMWYYNANQKKGRYQ